jgi:cation diffusion facilitator family transporter
MAVGQPHAAHRHEHAHSAGAEHGESGSRPAAHGENARLDSGRFTEGEARQARRLTVVLLVIMTFFVLELAGAIVADSVVLQADALHLLMDVLALGVSLSAMRLAVRRPTPRYTFGLRRAEPVAAIFSASLVLLTTAFIVAEALEALRGRGAPKANIMLVVAVLALFVNGLSAWLLHDVIGEAHGHTHGEDPDNPHGHEADHAPPPSPARRKAHGHALNLRGAWLHLVADTLGALAALAAAVVIRFGGSPSADAIASFVVAAILLFGSLRLLRDATLVLLEAAPAHLSVATIRRFIETHPGVLAVHDLHAWTLGAGHDAVTVHVRTDSPDPAFGQRLSEHIRRVLDVEYVTVQTELEGPPASRGNG